MTIVLVEADVARQFPKSFKFGASSSAYQVEGGWESNGKGRSVWDIITNTYPGWIKDGKNGNIACDSYNLWKRDVEMLHELGVDYYSFSISWTRLLPTGFANYYNPTAIKYYNDLINELLKHNIEPVVTLYHWDLPQSFEDMGGWLNPIIATYFENFANACFELFGDRVKTWITFNDPFEICVGGYGDGSQAPGVMSSGTSDYVCGKTLLLAHAKAYRLYKDKYARAQNGKIGIAVKAQWYEPGTFLKDDIEASIRAFQMISGWWIHPIFSKNGDYPDVMKSRIQTVSNLQNLRESRLPFLSASEISYIHGTADFLGLNHFSTSLIRNASSAGKIPVSFAADLNVIQESDPNWPSSALPWVKTVPFGFRKMLDWIQQNYDNPLVYITENGYPDFGDTNDIIRIDYIKNYLVELLNAIQYDNCNVQRYTVRSLMDSMEWRNGYLVKFGLYQVNFADSSLVRTAKKSAEYYKNVIKTKEIIQSSSFVPYEGEESINPR